MSLSYAVRKLAELETRFPASPTPYTYNTIDAIVAATATIPSIEQKLVYYQHGDDSEDGDIAFDALQVSRALRGRLQHYLAAEHQISKGKHLPTGW